MRVWSSRAVVCEPRRREVGGNRGSGEWVKKKNMGRGGEGEEGEKGQGFTRQPANSKRALVGDFGLEPRREGRESEKEERTFARSGGGRSGEGEGVQWRTAEEKKKTNSQKKEKKKVKKEKENIIIILIFDYN